MTDDLAKQLRTDAEAYRHSIAAPTSHDMFTLADQWQDKKHRHVWDLCSRLETAADRIEKLEDELLHCFHRINELQTALRMVIDWDNTLDWEDGPAWGDLMDIARKALEGKDG